MLILTHGVEAEAVGEYTLCCDIFDGANEDQLQAARQRWKKWKDHGDLTLSYFQKNERGGWEKKA